MALQEHKKIVKKSGDAFSTDEKVDLQPEETTKITSILPPSGHANVGFWAFDYLARITKEKNIRKLPQKWSRNYELFRARQWRSRGAARLSSVNLIWNHVSRTTNLLTDNNPTFDIHGEPDEVSSKINKAASFWWNETEQQDVLSQSIQMGEINGCVVEKIIFNPALENGLGDVEAITIDPHNFGFWPMNEMKEHKWEAALYFYPMDVNQARRMWPEFRDYIKSDHEWRKTLGYERKHIFGGTTRAIPGMPEHGDWGVDHATITGNANALGTIMGGKNEVLILEMWVKDYTTTPGEDGFAIPKYPGNIRCITACNGGNIVLSDRPNPSINPLLPPELASQTYLWSRFPFTLTPSNKDIVSPWGFSSIEQLEAINFEIDKCLSQLNLIKDKNARAPIINPRNANIPNSAFTNAPARVVNPKDHVTAAAVGFMRPPPVHRDIEHIMGIYRELFDRISGQADLTDPSVAKGRLAFKTVASIIESMHTMLRGKIRNYGKMIRDRGRMWLSHVQNWYTEERIFFAEAQAGAAEMGMFMGKEFIIPLNFQVVAGSTMPTSRLQNREEAKEIFGTGAIDIRELLTRLDWPNKAEVIRRMELGQMGQLIERMEALGVNPEIIGIIQEVGSMDESEYNAAVNQVKEAQADATRQIPETTGI